MCNINVKYERILTKLCTLNSQYIYEKPPNYVRKYYLIAELLIFKCL